MADTKYPIRLNEIVKRLMLVLHAFVQNVWEDEEEEREQYVGERDDESQPGQIHLFGRSLNYIFSDCRHYKK